jgi:hypothetical protein
MRLNWQTLELNGLGRPQSVPGKRTADLADMQEVMPTFIQKIEALSEG